MANFQEAISKILANEGGYANNPHDKGGETNYGISKRQYPHLDIANLTIQDAENIYLKDYWAANNLSSIVSQEAAEIIFDMFVNMRPDVATTCVQLAINYLCGKPLIEADGIFGSATRSAVNDFAASKWFTDRLRLERIAAYASIVKHDESQRANLLSWVNRALL